MTKKHTEKETLESIGKDTEIIPPPFLEPPILPTPPFLWKKPPPLVGRSKKMQPPVWVPTMPGQRYHFHGFSPFMLLPFPIQIISFSVLAEQVCKPHRVMVIMVIMVAKWFWKLSCYLPETLF